MYGSMSSARTRMPTSLPQPTFSPQNARSLPASPLAAGHASSGRVFALESLVVVLSPFETYSSSD